jgi:hypothetical protein
MTQPRTPEELKAALIAKIHRLQQRGENADGQIKALMELMTAAQNRHLRVMSNKRFGKRRAKELRKQNGGHLAFPKEER